MIIVEDGKCSEEIVDVANYWNEKMPMMTMEECAELIQAISKMERYTEDDEPRGHYHTEKDLIGEIGDVIISMNALMYIYGLDFDRLADYIFEKLNRTY